MKSPSNHSEALGMPFLHFSVEAPGKYQEPGGEAKFSFPQNLRIQAEPIRTQTSSQSRP